MLIKAVTAMKERRRYPRLKANLIAGFRRLESLREYKDETTKDIGMGGFRVEVECPDPLFVIGRAMEITIRDPHEKDEPVRGIGRIIWMREKEDRSACEVGVMLTYIRAEDMARYVKFFSVKNPA